MLQAIQESSRVLGSTSKMLPVFSQTRRLVCLLNPTMSGITIRMRKEMEPGDFVFMEDFTLHDAMGAFEVRKPSMACVGFADTLHDWGATPRQRPDP